MVQGRLIKWRSLLYRRPREVSFPVGWRACTRVNMAENTKSDLLQESPLCTASEKRAGGGGEIPPICCGTERSVHTHQAADRKSFLKCLMAIQFSTHSEPLFFSVKSLKSVNRPQPCATTLITLSAK